jgi:type I restriction enzyme S subunit
MMLNEYVLGDICDVKIGRTPPRAEKKWFNHDGNSYKWVSIKDIGNCKKYIYSTSETITREGQEKFNIPIVPKGTIILSFKLTVGRIAITTEDMLTNEAIAQIVIKDDTKVDKDYLYYYLKNYDYKSLGNTSSIGKAINSEIIKKMPIKLPDKCIQEEISSKLKAIDEKIIVDNSIIDKYGKLLNDIYTNMFNSLDKSIKKATELCDITIGKTPPRTEKECFSTDNVGLKWISISDMGNSGYYVFDTTENLTEQGYKKYNVKVVPKGTIILSFKLTVGRIAITTEDMLTNEAIAHFKLNDETYKYYLFMYLKNYDYKSLGNTSSIGKAINSKIIKDMDIEIPEKSKVIDFNHNVSKIFEHIYVIEKEINNLERVSVDIANKLIIK